MALRPGAGLLILAGVAGIALAGPASAARPAAGTDPVDRCTALVTLKLPDTTIVSAEAVTKTTQAGQSNLPPGLPPFCRLVVKVQGAPDSEIGVEIWLPFTWSGVFHGTGNGGFGGVLSGGYGAMAQGLRQGYSAATTDMGTSPATPLSGDALIGHPRKWRDWGRLSTHVMTVTGKAISRSFYGRDPARSYYTGCSSGGQQGLIEALHYPADYDGILVGAPVINRTWGHAAVLWNYAAAHASEGAFLSPAKLDLLNRGAVAQCGRNGFGLAGDAFIADPLTCRFDPAALLCKAGESESDQCLTAPQVATARAFYTGPASREGRALFYGWLPGSEGPGRYGWSFLQSGVNDNPQFASLFKWAYGAGWSWRGFDVERDMAGVDAVLDASVNDATRGTLTAFQRRGGKLIIYHGLADTLVPPGQSVAFYERQGGAKRLSQSARLFLAPGMMHCAGGPGPDVLNAATGGPPVPVPGPEHDLFRALVDWREKGRAPNAVIATKYSADGVGVISMQRPVCAYPKQARYIGTGSMSAASSFVCALPPGTR